MWQRIQTVFLLVSVVAAIAFLFLPIADLEGVVLYAKDDIITTAIAIAVAVVSIFIITQYKNRKLQLRLCMINILFAVALFAAALIAATSYSEYVHFEFAAGMPIVIIIALLFARRNIKKDDNLVKSMDRFR